MPVIVEVHARFIIAWAACSGSRRSPFLLLFHRLFSFPPLRSLVRLGFEPGIVWTFLNLISFTLPRFNSVRDSTCTIEKLIKKNNLLTP